MNTQVKDQYVESEDIQRLKFQAFFSQQSNEVTYVLVGAIAVIFLLETYFGGATFVPTLYRMGANSRTAVLEGEYYRLLTSVFLHAGLLHAAVNGYVLVALGAFFNRLLGPAKFFFVFCIAGIFGSLGSVLLSKAGLSVGASGAIWGLFGLSGALILKPSHMVPEALRLRIRKITFINLAINLPISMLPMVDLWAHLGGGLAGFVIGIFFFHVFKTPLDIKQKMPKRLDETKAWLKNPSSLVLIGLIVFAFSQAFSNGEPWELREPFGLQEVSLGDRADILLPGLIAKHPIETAQGFGKSYLAGAFPKDPMVAVLNFTHLPVLDEKAQKALLLREGKQQMSELRSFAKEISYRTLEIEGASWTLQTFEMTDQGTLYTARSIQNNQLISAWLKSAPDYQGFRSADWELMMRSLELK